MRVVVDASVVVKWILPDPEPDLDRGLLLLEAIQEGKAHPIQPPHWLAEAPGAPQTPELPLHQVYAAG